MASMRNLSLTGASIVLCLAVGWATEAQAQPPKAQTATQYYLSYRAAFDKATKAADLLPYMSEQNRKQGEPKPKEWFELIKMVSAVTGVKVTKEEATAAGGARLTAEGVSSDKKKTQGTITLVKEGGAWKIDDEE